MTHGEAYVFRRQNIDFTHDLDKILRSFDRLPKKMDRKDSLKYYSDKLRKVFGVDEVSKRDFIKIDDYFDYFEARRLLKGKK